MSQQPPYGENTPSLPVRLMIWLSRHTLMGHGPLRKVSRRFVERFHKGPVDTNLFGVPMRLNPHTNMSERKPMMRLDRYDHRERKFMHQILRKSEQPVMIDIGAHIAIYSLDAVLNGPPNTRAIAMEPQPELNEHIRFNLDAIKQGGNTRIDGLTLLGCAIGPENGTAQLAIPEGAHLAHVVREGGVEVPLKTLLSVLEDEKINHIDFLKIDIEGYEEEALGPFLMEAEDALLPRGIVMEHLHMDEWSHDINGLLAKRGYSESLRTRSNAIWTRDN